MFTPEDRPLAAIFGCSGPTLNENERQFFAKTNPLGFILFTRNCVDQEQTRRLTSALRECVQRASAPILIDQEGGRVSRLKPPNWRERPAAARFAAIAGVNEELAIKAVRLNARLIAAELVDIGVTFNCSPVLDVPQPNADPIIGDRAYGDTPKMVAALGRAVCEGLLDGGVLPVIKHIPGHGRAAVDSHHSMPVVEPMPMDLRNIDFAPFKALNDMPWAMTAHVVYRSIDAILPATTSSSVISGVIRGSIGFEGFLITDDLSMKALYGDMSMRASMSLRAGCDAVLHCNGDMAEMEAVAKACQPLSFEAIMRLEKAEARRRKPLPLDVKAAQASLEAML